MKTLNQYIKEKLIINKDYVDAHTLTPESFDELREIIEDRYEKLGEGTKDNPINFNDIDVSNLNSFYNKHKGKYGSGLFEHTKFKYIDISGWDVSNVKSMCRMFYWCKELKSVGDISNWDVSNANNMHCMFSHCNCLNPDVSSWDVSNVKDMSYMFRLCYSFNQDISGWDVSNVTNMDRMFEYCKSFNQDLSKWNLFRVSGMLMFDNCPIKYEYKPKFKWT